MDTLLAEIAKLFPKFDSTVGAGILIFVRLLAFASFAPVLSRKEMPSVVKVGFVFLLTISLTCVIKPNPLPANNDLMLSIMLNTVSGAIMGYMARLILVAVDAGADMINMQMGLSSAMVLDPATQKQVSIVEKLISMFGVMTFIYLGGIYWLFNAFMRSFDVFPIFATTIPLTELVNFDYLVKMTSNVLYMGLQIASPVLLATLGQDIILGTISKTAPQVNVFQLSFLFKPVFGCAILIWIMPMLFNVISDYFLSFSKII